MGCLDSKWETIAISGFYILEMSVKEKHGYVEKNLNPYPNFLKLNQHEQTTIYGDSLASKFNMETIIRSWESWMGLNSLNIIGGWK